MACPSMLIGESRALWPQFNPKEIAVVLTSLDYWCLVTKYIIFSYLNFTLFLYYLASCWAFTTTTAVEGINFIKTGETLRTATGWLYHIENHGCINGSVRNAFQYIMRSGGIVELKYYPYVARQNVCQRFLVCFNIPFPFWLDVKRLWCLYLKLYIPSY